MADFSSSANPPAGEYAVGDGERCDWCDRKGEWRFRLGKPRISTSVNRNHFVYGCGIHWQTALRWAEWTKR